MRPRNIALLVSGVVVAVIANIAITWTVARQFVSQPPAGNFGAAQPARGFAFGPQFVAMPDEQVVQPLQRGQQCTTEELQRSRGPAVATGDYQLSGPFTHENLSVFLIHGPDTMKDQRVITLQEAVSQNLAVVHDTGFSLTVDNRSDAPLFIQGGDIVKGGNQDRVLPYDYLIPAGATRHRVAAFCVEQGRSFPRGGESSTSFQMSAQQLPTRSLKVAALLHNAQNEIWSGVAQTQANLSRNIGGQVQAPQSQTSLQLTLEHPRVQQAAQAYVNKLAAVTGPNEQDNVIGYAVAINGKIQTADVYGSASLFRTLWPKLLQANAVAALAETAPGAAMDPPSTETVQAFLAAPEQGQAYRPTSAGRASLLRQETAQTVLLETCDSSLGNLVVHRCFLAK